MLQLLRKKNGVKLQLILEMFVITKGLQKRLYVEYNILLLCIFPHAGMPSFLRFSGQHGPPKLFGQI